MHLSNKLSLYSRSLLCKLLSALITNLWTNCLKNSVKGLTGYDQKIKTNYLKHMEQILLPHACDCTYLLIVIARVFIGNKLYSLLWSTFISNWYFWKQKLGNGSRDFKRQEYTILQNEGFGLPPELCKLIHSKRLVFDQFITTEPSLSYSFKVCYELKQSHFSGTRFKQEIDVRKITPYPAIHM